MCNAFTTKKGETIRPGCLVFGHMPEGAVCLPWVGRARSERLAWWQQQGGVLVDIEAVRYAVRANDTEDEIWNDIPADRVIRGIVDPRKGDGRELLRVVTRPATDAELTKFRHDRVPLLAESF